MDFNFDNDAGSDIFLADQGKYKQFKNAGKRQIFLTNSKTIFQLMLIKNKCRDYLEYFHACSVRSVWFSPL